MLEQMHLLASPQYSHDIQNRQGVIKGLRLAMDALDKMRQPQTGDDDEL